jgi:hypothetical protein
VACDEIAIVATGSAKRYASCLATLASLPPDRMVAWPVLSAASASGLRRRLGRILAPKRGAGIFRWRAIAVSASAALAIFGLVLGNFRVAELAASSVALPVSAVPTGVSSIASVSNVAAASGTTSASPSRGVRGAVSREPAESSTQSRRAVSPVTSLPQEIREQDIAAAAPVLPPPAVRSKDGLTSRPVSAPMPSATVVESVPGSPSASIASDAPPPLASISRTPWAAAADAGVAIGRGSQTAGVATAGFFRRFGKKIAASF